MILIYDANAYLRQSLNRLDPVNVNPRFVYEAANASPYPQLWVWDGGDHNERRRAIFPGYKIRDYTGQENIFAGLALYRELLAFSKATQIEVPEWEADDVCYTLAMHFAKKGVRTVIHTNDFDYFQLTTNAYITLKGVRPLPGVNPWHVPLYKTLVGDKSDKIDGIPGFGQKSWEAFSGLWDTLDGAFRDRDVDTILNQPWRPSARLWLNDNVEQLFAYYQITHMIDVPLDLIEQHTKPGTADVQAAQAIFNRFML